MCVFLSLTSVCLCHRYFIECLKIRFVTGTKTQIVPSVYKFLFRLIEVTMGRVVGGKRTLARGLRG